MTFHFSLQPALDATRTRERRLGSALHHLRLGLRKELTALESVDEFERRVRVHARSQRHASSQSLSAGVAIDRELCRVALGVRRRRHVAAIRAAHVQIEAADDRHKETLRERHALERLRTRRYAAFLAETERRQANDYDESNALGYEAGFAAARKYAS